MCKPKRTIRERLLALAAPDFQRFAASLLPNVENLLGVRLPKLRALARRIAKCDWRAHLAAAQAGSFEAVMLRGMVIGCAAMPPEERLALARSFVPKIRA